MLTGCESTPAVLVPECFVLIAVSAPFIFCFFLPNSLSTLEGNGFDNKGSIQHVTLYQVSHTGVHSLSLAENIWSSLFAQTLKG